MNFFDFYFYNKYDYFKTIKVFKLQNLFYDQFSKKKEMNSCILLNSRNNGEKN